MGDGCGPQDSKKCGINSNGGDGGTAVCVKSTYLHEDKRHADRRIIIIKNNTESLGQLEYMYLNKKATFLR
jgi:hypothetical protein